jgi:hypothetical protein
MECIDRRLRSSKAPGIPVPRCTRAVIGDSRPSRVIAQRAPLLRFSSAFFLSFLSSEHGIRAFLLSTAPCLLAIISRNGQLPCRNPSNDSLGRSKRVPALQGFQTGQGLHSKADGDCRCGPSVVRFHVVWLCFTIPRPTSTHGLFSLLSPYSTTSGANQQAIMSSILLTRFGTIGRPGMLSHLSTCSYMYI